MTETRFKTLVYAGTFVDVNLLEKGIYGCRKPSLYDMVQTIESLINDAEKLQDLVGRHNISDKYIENLRQCKMVELVLSEVKEN